MVASSTRSGNERGRIGDTLGTGVTGRQFRRKKMAPLKKSNGERTFKSAPR